MLWSLHSACHQLELSSPPGLCWSCKHLPSHLEVHQELKITNENLIIMLHEQWVTTLLKMSALSFHFLKPCKSSSMILFSVFVEVKSSILILTVLQEVSIDYNFKDIPNLCLQKRWSKRCWKIRKWNWTRKDRRVSRGVSSATLSRGGLSLLMQQYFLIFSHFIIDLKSH